MQENIKNKFLNFMPLILLCGMPVVFVPELYYFVIEEYYFFITVLLCLLAGGIYLLKKRTFTVNFNNADIAIGVFAVYTLINSLLVDQQLDLMKTLMLAFLAMLYLFIRRLKTKKQRFEGLINSLMFVGLAEISSAVLQYLGIIEKLQTNMPFGGSFANPAPLSVFLACIVPMVLHALLSCRSHRAVQVLRIVFLASAVGLLAAGQIRSSWIALAIGSTLVISARYRLMHQVSKASLAIKLSLAVAVLAIISAGAFSMFKLKKDSALGRVFIWENSFDIVQKQPLIGHGVGSFIYEYNQAQMDRFENGNYSDKQFLLADDIKMAYNDLLQITAELGIIGLILVLAVLFIIVKNFIHPLQKQKENTQTDSIAPLSAAVAMLAAGMFSYPFTIVKSQALFVICLALLSNSLPVIKSMHFSLKKIQTQVVQVSFMAICSALIAACVQQHQCLHIWKKAIDTHQNGNRVLAAHMMENIQPQLSHHFYFNFNYASVLISLQHTTKIQKQLRELDKTANSYDYFIMKGDYYLGMKNYIAAKQAFEKAKQLIPSRFIPRFNLMVCHTQLGEKKEAIGTAHEILEMPVKIYSEAVGSIQNSARELLGISGNNT